MSLVVALVRQAGTRRVFLTSGPSDAEAARRIADAARRGLGPLATRCSRAGRLQLTELRALIARAALFVGGDSGPLHIAATTSTPIVELLGPTLAERSYPWRDPRWFSEIIDAGALPCRPCHQRTCVPGDFRCLTSIGPDRVIAAAERALRSAAGSRRDVSTGRTNVEFQWCIDEGHNDRHAGGARRRAGTRPADDDASCSAFVAAVQLSIAAAQILLSALLLCWVVGMVRDKTRPAAPTFFLALLAYAGITLISSVFSVAPLESFIDDRQLLLFLIVPAVYDLARGAARDDWRRT